MSIIASPFTPLTDPFTDEELVDLRQWVDIMFMPTWAKEAAGFPPVERLTPKQRLIVIQRLLENVKRCQEVSR